jgi:Carboxypeptidase regulatory-like domain
MRADLLCTLFAALVAASPALANGGDFFEELSSSWNQNNSDDGVPYFGFVRDSKGKMIPNATITATTATGSSFVVQADTMGHYRIPGFSKSVDSKRVQVTCAKTGYKLVARDRRLLRGAPNAPVETNCILAPDVNKPAA